MKEKKQTVGDPARALLRGGGYRAVLFDSAAVLLASAGCRAIPQTVMRVFPAANGMALRLIGDLLAFAVVLPLLARAYLTAHARVTGETPAARPLPFRALYAFGLAEIGCVLTSALLAAVMLRLCGALLRGGSIRPFSLCVLTVLLLLAAGAFGTGLLLLIGCHCLPAFDRIVRQNEDLRTAVRASYRGNAHVGACFSLALCALCVCVLSALTLTAAGIVGLPYCLYRAVLTFANPAETAAAVDPAITDISIRSDSKWQRNSI